MESELTRATALLAEAHGILAALVARSADDALGALLGRIYALAQGQRFTARLIADAAAGDAELRDGLVRAGCPIPTSPTSVTAWLNRLQRRELPGWRLERTSRPGGATLWTLHP